jgi:hypothetical protein
MSEAVVRSTVGQLMAAVKLLCVLKGADHVEAVADIKSCLSEDLNCITNGRKLDRILKRHIAILEASDSC